ncbi:MAG: dihydropteroate synthase [Deltaproteobacteria bacterium CG11_big_fil_rev_8_21_14_0_20_47_16]|nr:MAG: dihydropteroate synthase [Deltaproteobacteria bacterium CG11_big_fil_rev_8_21_14_0_20_47_16]
MKIMAVVNVTPDSFFDGGNHNAPAAAIAHAMRCVEEGADILDIGGESSRPGAQPVNLNEERSRVLPVIEGIRKHHPKIPISLDTTKALLVREASQLGVQHVNDITALRGDPEMASTVAQLKLNIILMHMQGTPQNMQARPQYEDVTSEVIHFFQERISVALSAGVAKDRIFLDPGIGFGKTVSHNVSLLQQLGRLSQLSCPLIVGTSRKSFIGQLTATDDPNDRLPGTLATLPVIQRSKVAIVRVHDVAATKQFLTVFNAL